jgi:hypothetical protein
MFLKILMHFLNVVSHMFLIDRIEVTFDWRSKSGERAITQTRKGKVDEHATIIRVDVRERDILTLAVNSFHGQILKNGSIRKPHDIPRYMISFPLWCFLLKFLISNHGANLKSTAGIPFK